MFNIIASIKLDKLIIWGSLIRGSLYFPMIDAKSPTHHLSQALVGDWGAVPFEQEINPEGEYYIILYYNMIYYIILKLY